MLNSTVRRRSLAEKPDLPTEVAQLRQELREVKAMLANLAGNVRETRSGAGRVRTFVEGFDEAIEGGVPRGHVVLVAGPS